MKKAPNPKVMLGLAAATLVGGGAFLYVQNGKLDSTRSDVAKLRSQVAKEKEIYKQLDASRQGLADLKAKLAHLEHQLPDAAYVPIMLKELAENGRQHGIEVTGLRPITPPPTPAGKQADKKPYDTLDMELKGRGKYMDLLRFVESLDSFPQIVSTRTVTLGVASTNHPGPGQAVDDHTLDITLNLRAFLFKEQGAQDKAPVPGGTT